MLCKLGRAAVNHTWNDLCMIRIAFLKLKDIFLIGGKYYIGTLKVPQIYRGSTYRLDSVLVYTIMFLFVVINYAELHIKLVASFPFS